MNKKMNPVWSALALPIALCALTPWAQAEPGGTTPDDELCCAAPAGEEVGATNVLTLPLTGLNGDTEGEFIDAIQTLGRTVYECAGHPELTSEEPGVCEPCGGAELAARRIRAFESLSVEATYGAQTCLAGLAPGAVVRLSDLMRVLERCSASLDLSRLDLGEDASLHVSGLTCGGCVSKVDDALRGLESVAAASCSFDASAGSLASMTVASGQRPTYERVKQAIEQAGFSLADVSWRGGERSPEPEREYDAGITGFAKRLGGNTAELLVHGLVPGGAAEKAGLRAGDRILTIDGGVAFEFTRGELRELLGSPEAVQLVVERAGEKLEIEVVPQLVEREENKADVPESTARTVSDRKAAGKPSRGLTVGELAPEIDGVDLDGIPFKLSDYRGKVTVVSFWGFW